MRSPNWIGDQVIAYPFFHFLRRAYPRARIVTACVPWVEPIQFRNLVDDSLTLPKPVDRSWGARWRALEESAQIVKRAGSWDLGIALPNSFSAAWLLYRAGVPRRRGFATEGRGFLLNEPEDWAPAARAHRADAYLKLLKRDGVRDISAAEFWGTHAENDLDPSTPGVLPGFDPAKAWPVSARLEVPAGDYWVLAPGSAAESRRWPLIQFAALARIVKRETGLPGVVVGGPAEAPLASELCEDRSLGLLDRTAQGPPSALTDLFRGAKFCISNDSGLAHVAALAGCQTFVVWGAGDPTHTRPLGPGKVRILANPVECWPCEKNTCGNPAGRKLECLLGISPDSVWEEVSRGIRG